MFILWVWFTSLKATFKFRKLVEFLIFYSSLVALGVVLESIPFFGDVLLRLPDMTKEVKSMLTCNECYDNYCFQIYKRHRKDWVPIFKWGMEFCQNSTFLFTGHYSTQLYLVRI